MTSYAGPRLAEETGVEAALRSAGCEIKARGSRRWEVRRAAEDPLAMLAEEDGAWLLLSVPVQLNARNDWELLIRLGVMPPLLKLTLAPANGLRLRADLAVADPGLLAKRATEVIGDFPSALSALAGGSAGWAQGAAGPESMAAAWRQPVEALLERSDWPYTTHGDGRVSVRLEVPDGRPQAIVESVGAGVRLAAEVGAWPQLAEESRDALGVFVLTLSHALRLARGFVRRDEAGITAGFEVLLPSEPAVAEVRDGLGALSVACRLGAAELMALADSTVAREYLQVRGETQVKQQNERKQL